MDPLDPLGIEKIPREECLRLLERESFVGRVGFVVDGRPMVLPVNYLAEGGSGNAEHALRFAAALIGRPAAWREPAPLLRAGLYWPGKATPTLADKSSAVATS